MSDDSTGKENKSVKSKRAKDLGLLSDIPVKMSLEVGSTSLSLAELLDLAEGSVVELDRQANELLDVVVNGKLIAKGEVVTVNGRFGVRIVDVVSNENNSVGDD
ncbi:MAG: flagellar motor switch protein FliN [Zymomonas mobilis]|uniref:Flagellar motor switch protein FliN n=1 Tax=Zymomonas mobilis TaxID=542 RepID=A0A542W0K0_ZYMMB|nr:flagellar motor switch protein FliN [Zymomonas mobilis]TQL17105.1 flagellar motor switch protein FliN/FliY [Zymomonas mobilis]